MTARPNLKDPGRTMTGRQWRTVEALQADGWLVLPSDPILWSEAETARLRDGLEQIDEYERAQQGERP